MVNARQQGARRAYWASGIAAIVIGIAAIWYVKSATSPAKEEKGGIPRKWEFAASGAITGIALAEDGTVYATSADGFLWALDPSGNIEWKFEAGPMKAGPTLGADGTVYLTNSKQMIYAIDHTGNQVWSNGGGPYADTNTGIGAAALDYDYLYTIWR